MDILRCSIGLLTSLGWLLTTVRGGIEESFMDCLCALGLELDLDLDQIRYPRVVNFDAEFCTTQELYAQTGHGNTLFITLVYVAALESRVIHIFDGEFVQ